MIHPTAIVENSERIAVDVTVGPFCVVGPHVSIGSGTILHNSVTVLGRTVIGKNNALHPYCVVGGDPQDLKFRGEDSETVIGDDNILRENCSINKGTTGGGGKTVIGNRNYIMACSHIAHDTVIEDHCIFANASLLAGHIKVENWAIVSGQVSVAHFATIGQHAFIGGGSAVNTDAPPYMILQGVHAKVLGVNSVGLRRRGFSAQSVNALRECYRILWRSGMPRSDSMAQVESKWGMIPEVRILIEFLRASERGRLGRGREAFRTTPIAPEAELLE